MGPDLFRESSIVLNEKSTERTYHGSYQDHHQVRMRNHRPDRYRVCDTDRRVALYDILMDVSPGSLLFGDFSFRPLS